MKLLTNRTRVVIGAVSLGLVVTVPAPPAASAAVAPHAERGLPSGNLILNPGAEAGVGGDLPDWTTSPGFVAEQYGAQFRPPVSVSQAIGGGAQLFAGGSEATVSTGTQYVDVSSSASEIDGGGVTANLSAYLGGIDAEGDYASVAATFLPATGNVALGSTLALAPVTNGDRGYITAMLPRSGTKPVPSGTRRILITITSIRTDGTYTDGYADNLSLTLSGSSGSHVKGQVKGIKSPGRRIKGKINAQAPCKSGRKVVIKKGSKTVGSGRTKSSGSFNIKTKKHKKGKLTVSVKKRTVSSTVCQALTKTVPGRN